ncbi:MAG: tryptophan synthase subunit alpha [Acidobacteria bacterium]|nr:tryptophan synthase subunit alpha [Acidobacteriota bacterium]
MANSRIARRFAELRAKNEPALVAYVTAGDPTLDATVGIVAALERGGADVIELGVPFSDPIADGPVIMKGAERALAAGASLRGVLDCAARIRAVSDIPILLFSYLNPLMRYGFAKLAADAHAAGVDGVLMTDVSVEEAEPYVASMRDAGLDTVFLAAPTSTPERLALVGRFSSGFVYLVSRTGVTGVRDQVSSQALPLVERMREHTSLPLAVGFGIAKAADAEAVGRLADGVVVGSAFVKLIEAHAGTPELEPRIEALARELKNGAMRSRMTAQA